jgi:hypothetical protein
MLRSLANLQDYSIGALDGTIGHVKDFYFDDKAWVIRYLVVETGAWLPSRKVLISPIALGNADWAAKLLPVSLTMEQVKGSPDIDTERPVSRKHERSHLGYYGYPHYWEGEGLWGNCMAPGMLMPSAAWGGNNAESRREQTDYAQLSAAVDAQANKNEDQHLCSCKTVMHYHVHAADGDIGHVHGLLVDEDTWAIRYMIVDTSNWWIGHKVLISPRWIRAVMWPEASISVDLNRDAVKSAPPYDPKSQMGRDDEAGLYSHDGRPGYWEDEADRDRKPHV